METIINGGNIMERVIYKKNPLIEVIIQFRFPQILALNNSDPVRFQEEIKDDYPIYNLEIQNQHEISFTIEQDGTVPSIPSIIQRQPRKNHSFISADGMYKVNLTNSFIAISTLAYTRWEDMLMRFEKPLLKFEELYKPPFYGRIGLRYIDAFSRKRLNLDSVPWKELITPFCLGAFETINEDEVINVGLDVEYRLSDGISQAKIHSGLGNVNNDPERVFLIDSDFIRIENTPKENSKVVLDYLHDNAKKFIRSTITDKLHFAMEPEPVK